MISETEQQISGRYRVKDHEVPLSSDFPVDEAPPLTFGAMLRILHAGRRRVLYCGLAALLVASLISVFLTNVYSATTSFVPPGATSTQSSLAMMSQLSGLGGAGLLGSHSQGDLYVGILKSHTIARYLVQTFDLEKVYRVKKESQAEKVLGANTLVETGSKDPIVTITVTDRSPQRARDLANGYLKALQSTSAQLALTESSQRRLFYEQRLAQEKNNLADAEVALKQAEESTGLIAPAGQTSSEIQTLAQLNGQIVSRQAQLAALLSQESDENSDVIRMRSEISSLEARVKQLQTGTSREPFGHTSTAQIPALQLEYIRKARDVKYHETLFDIIAKQYEAARLDEAKDAPLQVLDHAVVPDMKSGPHRSIIIALGLLIGLLGGSAWTLLRYARQTRPMTL